MSSEDVEDLAKEVPMNQRDELVRRAEWMLSKGWRHVGLWCYGGADVSDLVGVPPNQRQVSFFPGWETIDEPA